MIIVNNFPYNAGNDDETGKPMIYESPDGGKTVTAREFGEKPGSLDSKFWKVLEEDKMWGDMRRKCSSDAGLKDLMDCAIMYYKLKYTKKE